MLVQVVLKEVRQIAAHLSVLWCANYENSADSKSRGRQNPIRQSRQRALCPQRLALTCRGTCEPALLRQFAARQSLEICCVMDLYEEKRVASEVLGSRQLCDGVACIANRQIESD